MKLTIPIEPRTKKNSSQIIYNKKLKRAMVIPSPQYKKYEKECGSYLPKMEEVIDYPVEITAHFYMKTRRRVDLTNLLEALDDILVKYKIISDDNYKILVSHDGSRVHYDKEFPRTEIEIKEVKDGF